MKSKKYQIPSIHKAINILELLKEHGSPLTLKEIVDKLRLPTSTCYNILSTLEDRGFINRTKSGHFNLGLSVMNLGLSIYNRLDFREAGRFQLKQLSDKFGETTYLSIIDKPSFKGIIIETFQGNRNGLVYSRKIGDSFPIYASGTGKSLMSGLSENELKLFFQKTELVPYTSKTITNEDILRKEIQEIKKNGYAISDSAYEENVMSVSAPVNDYLGKTIAAISLVGPNNRISPELEKIIPVIKQTAKNISEGKSIDSVIY